MVKHVLVVASSAEKLVQQRGFLLSCLLQALAAYYILHTAVIQYPSLILTTVLRIVVPMYVPPICIIASVPY